MGVFVEFTEMNGSRSETDSCRYSMLARNKVHKGRHEGHPTADKCAWLVSLLVVITCFSGEDQATMHELISISICYALGNVVCRRHMRLSLFLVKAMLLMQDKLCRTL